MQGCDAPGVCLLDLRHGLGQLQEAAVQHRGQLVRQPPPLRPHRQQRLQRLQQARDDLQQGVSTSPDCIEPVANCALQSH